jgi:hypothetical protein
MLVIMGFLFKADMIISIEVTKFFIKIKPDEVFNYIPEVKWYHQHLYLLSAVYSFMIDEEGNRFSLF